jgi:hypothetical protein
MTIESKPPSSRDFSQEEIPTVQHRLTIDAVAHLYEIQAEIERTIEHIESLQYDSHLRVEVLNSLSRIKNKIRLFERYLGTY